MTGLPRSRNIWSMETFLIQPLKLVSLTGNLTDNGGSPPNIKGPVRSNDRYAVILLELKKIKKVGTTQCKTTQCKVLMARLLRGKWSKREHVQ